MLSNNYQNILIKFGLWLATGLLIIIIGISNVFAFDTSQYYAVADVSSKLQQLVSTNYGSSPFNNPINSGYAFGEVLQVDNIVSNFSFQANKVYQLEVHLAHQKFVNSNAYSVSGLNGESCLISYENSIMNNDAYPRWAFQCPHTTNTITVTITNSSGNYLWSGTNIFDWVSATIWASDTLSFENSDTDNIINNQNQNTQDIINNQNQNTQDIINNQNQNTQQQIESQKVCNENYILISNLSDLSTWSVGALSSSGSISTSLNAWRTSDYINISIDDIITISKKSAVVPSVTYCLFNQNKTLNQCIKSTTSTVEFTSSIDGYIKVNFPIYEFPSSIEIKSCKNGNQALNDSINDLNSSLTDSSPVDMGSLGNTAGWLPPGPIDSIINLPLNLFNNLLTALNGTCQPINIPLPYVDKNLPIPCISTIFNQITGLPTFWNWVGAITSVVILYRYLLALYKYYDDLTTLKANFISDFGGEP